MKVNKRSATSSVASAGRAYGKAKRTEEAKPARESDSVEVSASGSLFQVAKEAIAEVPDIRTEAVAPIQKEMDDGTYHRDEHEVAEKVIDDHIGTPVS